MEASFEELEKALAAKIEEAAESLRSEVKRTLEAYRLSLETFTIKPGKPVDWNDPAVKWARRKLLEIQGKHPSFAWSFTIGEPGKVIAVRLSGDDKAVADAESILRWAFEKASSRPAGEG